MRELKEVIREASGCGGRNTSVKIPEPFNGIINYRDDSITLADVLIALGDGYANEFTSIEDGKLYWKFDSKEIGFHWDLKENLDGQSKTTIKELKELLI